MPKSAHPDRLSCLLASGLDALGLLAGQGVGADQQQHLLDYLALLQKWNRVYNLTSIRDPAAMVVRHLLDSLAIVPLIGSGRLLDVGTGAGLPAVPLAIVRPDLQVTALDSNIKKTRFVTQVKLELGLANLDVVHARVEQLADACKHDPAHYYDWVVSRAFSELEDFVGLAGPYCARDGRLLAMKGRHDSAPTLPATSQWHIGECRQLEVPGLEAQRSVVCLSRGA